MIGNDNAYFRSFPTDFIPVGMHKKAVHPST
jgi:hypothetical protein